MARDEARRRRSGQESMESSPYSLHGENRVRYLANNTIGLMHFACAMARLE